MEELNSNTPPETLDRLANDKDSWVRLGVARHPNTSPETLDRLANDEFWLNRSFVAQNPNTSSETLERLVNDKKYVVRLRVSENPNTPQYIKDYLKINKFLKSYNIKLKTILVKSIKY